MKMVGKPTVMIDTNILLRYLIQDFPEYPKIKKVVDDLIYQGYQIWISRQIIREFSTVCTRPQNFMNTLSSLQVTQHILTFPQMFKIADEDARVTQALVQLMQTIPLGGKQIHDANIVATMQVYYISNLVTLNIADFARFQALITLIPTI
jgi:predicted nucleic acid-binding protein